MTLSKLDIDGIYFAMVKSYGPNNLVTTPWFGKLDYTKGPPKI
ncbi:MAG: hypothetical protein WAT92_05615 [Saprospiraceae bacterium]